MFWQDHSANSFKGTQPESQRRRRPMRSSSGIAWNWRASGHPGKWGDPTFAAQESNIKQFAQDVWRGMGMTFVLGMIFWRCSFSSFGGSTEFEVMFFDTCQEWVYFPEKNHCPPPQTLLSSIIIYGDRMLTLRQTNIATENLAFE